jgi:hypothetical protein
MSIDKIGNGTEDRLTHSDLSAPVETRTPETPRPRVRQAIASGASRVRQAAPARVRQASGAVRRNPAPAAGMLALAGGVLAVLLVRRRAAQARTAKSTRRWVPARFQR